MFQVYSLFNPQTIPGYLSFLPFVEEETKAKAKTE